VIQLFHTGMQGQGAAKAPRVKWEPKTRKYHLARTRVLTDTFETIRRRQAVFPRAEDCQEFFDHFLAVSLEYKVETNVQRYVNINPDDSLHATTYCMLAGELFTNGDFKGHAGSLPVPMGNQPDVWNENPDPSIDALY
jgi:hypothetical protein